MRSKVIKVYVDDDELSHINEFASRTLLTRSNLLRRVIMGYNVPNQSLNLATRDILKVNADMARLGNLLKGMMDKHIVDPTSSGNLIKSLQRTQQIIRDKIITLHRKERL